MLIRTITFFCLLVVFALPFHLNQPPAYAQSVGCDHTIGLEIDTADARTNYDQVEPGDTVCIEAGQRVSLKLENFEGTPTEPITFINDGGQVVFDGTEGMALRFANSRYFRITGTGDPNYQYGFKIDGNYHFGFRVHFKSSDFEIDHIEVRNTNGAGVMAQTTSTCPDGSTNTHDYDNDGIVIGDQDDVVTRENFTQYNSVVHDSFFFRTHSESIYFGNSHFGDGVTLSCSGQSKLVFNPLLKGVDVYNNIIMETQWDSLQVGSAVENCKIHHNQVYRDSLENKPTERSGIGSNRGSVCDIYNNYLEDSGSKAIRTYVYGDIKVYNNVVVNAGKLDSSGGYGIWVMNGGTDGMKFEVINNTIVSASNYGIKVSPENFGASRIQNNIIVSPDSLYLTYKDGSPVTVSNNLFTSTLNDVKFVNPSSMNYALTPDSPAVDAGVDLSILFDFLGSARPQGLATDIGAYELPANSAPITGLSLQTNPAPPLIVGHTVQFKASITSGNDVTYDWDFGDGTKIQNGGASVSHTYLSAGIHTVEVVATNAVSTMSTSSTATVIVGDHALHLLYLPFVGILP